MGTGSAPAGPGDESREGRPDRPETEVADRTRGGARFRPTLLVNPPTDRHLREALDLMLDRHAPATPAELQALVRPEYPSLVVRARQLEHESVIVWYVYREGYWVPAAKEQTTEEAP